MPPAVPVMSLVRRRKRQVVLPWATVSLAFPVWFHDIGTGHGTKQLSCRRPSVWGCLLFSWKFASGVGTLGRARGSSGAVCRTAISPSSTGVNSEPVGGSSFRISMQIPIDTFYVCFQFPVFLARVEFCLQLTGYRI